MNQELENEQFYQVALHKLSVFDDYYKFEIIGDISEDEAKRLNEIQDKHFKGKQYFILCDLGQMGTVGSTARKEIAAYNSQNAPLGVAFWRANFQTKLLASLVLNAINLFSKRPTLSTFVKTEQEALSWVERKRKELLK